MLTVRSTVDLHNTSLRSLLRQREDAQRVDAVFGNAMDATESTFI